jgi:hypothetical protein
VQFGRQQPAETQQAGLSRQWRIRALAPAAHGFRRGAAWPRCCACNRARETTLPTTPVPSRRAGPGRGIARPCSAGGPERRRATIRDGGVIQFTQRGATFAEQIFREIAEGMMFQLHAQVRRVGRREHFAMPAWADAPWRTFPIPDDMQDDMLEGGVLVVAVRAPAGALQVHLDVSGDRRLRAELDDGVAKIRAAFDADKTRMKHAHGWPSKVCNWWRWRRCCCQTDWRNFSGGVSGVSRNVAAETCCRARQSA